MPLHPKNCFSVECDVDGRRLEAEDGGELRLDSVQEAVRVARSFGWSVLASGSLVLCETRDADHQAEMDALLPHLELQVPGQIAIGEEVSE